MHIDLGALYQETAKQLREAELKVAELRGKMALIEQLARQTEEQEQEKNGQEEEVLSA